MQHLRGFIALRASRKLVSKLSKANWKNLLLHRADQLEQSVVQNDNRSTFYLLRAMQPYVPRKEHRLRNSHGNITAGLVEEQIVIQEHFSTALGGTACSFAALTDRDRVSAAAFAAAKDSVVESIAVGPTRISLKRRHRQSALRKAFGEAGVGAEVRRLCPDVMTCISKQLCLCVPQSFGGGHNCMFCSKILAIRQLWRTIVKSCWETRAPKITVPT